MPNEDLRLRAIVEKRFRERQFRHEGQVRVRDVIVIGEGSSCKGEFTGVNFFFNKSKLRDEADDSLIARMHDEISALAHRVAAIHLADNFIDADKTKMREDKKDCVTRLTSNEFYFYPYAKRGALKNESFANLLTRIESLAATLPENLHLILSSFPVMDADNQVHNTVVHVQCGELPRLYAFSKSMPSSVDPKYPSTVMPFFMMGPETKGILRVMSLLIGEIFNGIRQAEPVISQEKLKRLYHQLKLFEVPSRPDALALIQALASDSKNKKAMIRVFPSVMKRVIAEIEEKKSKDLGAIQAAILKSEVKFSKLPASGSLNAAVNYSGLIPCRTKGGADFTTAIGICLDESDFITKRMYMNALNHQTKGMPLLIPTQVSQVVTSNSISMARESIFAGDLIHADANLSLVNMYSKLWVGPKNPRLERWEASRFGLNTTLFIYPARDLARVGDDLGEMIRSLNQLSIRTQTLLMMMHRYPGKEEISRQVNDIKLRMAFHLMDFDQITALLREKANILYEGEDGVSTLLLAKNKDKLLQWLSESGELVRVFQGFIESGDERLALALYDQACVLGIQEKLRREDMVPISKSHGVFQPVSVKRMQP
jgi:hypothetical protein